MAGLEFPGQRPVGSVFGAVGAPDQATNLKRLQDQLARGQISQSLYGQYTAAQPIGYTANQGQPAGAPRGAVDVNQPVQTPSTANLPPAPGPLTLPSAPAVPGAQPAFNPASVGPVPTFQAPAVPVQGQAAGEYKAGTAPSAPQARGEDPRIAQLLSLLTSQAGQRDTEFESMLAQLRQPLAVRPYSFSGGDEATQLRQRLSDLLAGKGVDIGDINADPEARAYRIARIRESERQRTAAAERLGAQGLTGSGEFETTVGQVGEGAARDISGFEASLAGRRRGERLGEFTTASQLTLANLARQEQAERSRYEGELSAAQAGRAGLISAAQLRAGQTSQDQSGKLATLQALLAAQAQGDERSAREFAQQLQAYETGETARRGEFQSAQEAGRARSGAELGRYETELGARRAEYESQVGARNRAVDEGERLAAVLAQGEKDRYSRELAAYEASVGASQLTRQAGVQDRTRALEEIAAKQGISSKALLDELARRKALLEEQQQQEQLGGIRRAIAPSATRGIQFPAVARGAIFGATPSQGAIFRVPTYPAGKYQGTY